MKTMIFAILAVVIGIGAANAGTVSAAPAPIQEEGSSNWVNG